MDWHEKNVSTQQTEAGPYPRLPRSYGYPWRQESAESPPCQRPGPAVTLDISALPERKAGFARCDRLLTPQEYSWVFQQPVKSADGYFTVLGRRRGGGPSRLGLVVSKKNVKRAVDRNRIKRVIRESFRHNRLALDEMDIVVLGRRGVESQSNRILADSLSRHWKTIRDKNVSCRNP